MVTTTDTTNNSKQESIKQTTIPGLTIHYGERRDDPYAEDYEKLEPLKPLKSLQSLKDSSNNPAVHKYADPRFHSTEYLNQLVLDYREDVKDSADRLIEAFKPITKKYVRLCTQGIWDSKDADITQFLKMMGNTGDLRLTAEMLTDALNCYESVDIEQEAVLALLTTARKYTNISVNYKFVFKRQLKDLIKDPLVYSNVSSQGDDNGGDEDNGKKPTLYPDMDSYRSVQDEEIEINSAWVSGLTTASTYGFDRLTALQRALIKILYHDQETEEIAMRKLHIGSVRTLQRELDTIKNKLSHVKAIQKFFRDDLKELQPKKKN